LSQDLVSAMVVRYPPLLELTKKNPGESLRTTEPSHSLQFDQRKVIEMTKTDNGRAINRLLKKYSGDQAYLRQMFRLWYRIARLFNLEGNGEANAYQNNTNTRIPNMTTVGGVKGIDGTVIYDCYESKVAPDQLQFNQCQLCCAGSEQCIKDKTTSEFVGLGCSLVSSLGSRQHMPSSVCEGQSPYFSKAKTILLHIATTLPQSLRLERGTNQQKDRNTVNIEPQLMLWDDSHFQYWCKFVEQSETIRRLIQALVILLRNLNKQKLPTWWRSARGGWSKPVALVASTVTISTVLLHLYVLDAAVAEFEKGSQTSKKRDSIKKPPVSFCNDVPPEESNSKSVAKQMESIIKWAEKLGIDRIAETAHGDFCVTCDDGGNLLCCEYCPTVQHAYCADPPIENPDSISQWVCSACTKDIEELKEETF